MDEATIQKIAAEVVARLPFGDHYGLFLVINVLVMALAAALAAFAGSYLKTRGQHFATKADFDSLQDQLSAQTRLVETIKSDVAQKDWAQREWANLRRLKLEALFDKMRDCDVELERRCHALFHGPPLKDVPDYMDYVKEFEQISLSICPSFRNKLVSSPANASGTTSHSSRLMRTFAKLAKTAPLVGVPTTTSTGLGNPKNV
jgi:hypothetical protein